MNQLSINHWSGWKVNSVSQSTGWKPQVFFFFTPRYPTRWESSSGGSSRSLSAVPQTGAVQTDGAAAGGGRARVLLLLQSTETGAAEEGGSEEQTDPQVTTPPSRWTSDATKKGCLLCEICYMWSMTLCRYDNRCRHLHPDQVQEKMAKGEAHVIRFRLKEGVEPFEDMIFGWNRHDVAQVRLVGTSELTALF